MSYFIRERIKGSAWDFMCLNVGDFDESSAEPFNTKKEAMAAWAGLTDHLKSKHSRAYIIGPHCGCYRPSDGVRLRKDPES